MEFLQNLIEPLSSKFGNTLPSILGALLILIIGLWLSKIVRKLIIKWLGKTGIDEKINVNGQSKFSVVGLIAMLAYYILVIYVLVIVLNMLGVGDVFSPVEEMLHGFMTAIPKIVVAAIIGFAGYIIAKLVSEAIELFATSLNSFTAQIGFDASKFNLVKILKQIVFLFIFIPMAIVAVQKLDMPAISDPATAMLAKFMDAIPNIIGAALIIAVFFVIAKFITPALRELLKNLGTDALPEKFGLKFMANKSLSGIVANVVFFFIVLAGLMSGLERLGMIKLVSSLNEIMVLSGKIFFGLVIMVIGNLISRVASETLNSSSDNTMLASIARIAILGIFFSIGLNSMGIANEIVNLAFGLTLGAVAVAVALSFGLGGREAAGKQMDHILKRFRKDN